MGLEAVGHGLVLGLAEGVLDVVQFGAVGRQVVQVEVLFQQIRPGLPHLRAAVDGGVVQDHHARDAAVGRQGLLQEGDHVLARPGTVGRPPGQGRRQRLAFGVGVGAAKTFTRCS